MAHDAYLAVVIRTSALTGPPGSTILTGLGSAVPRIPGRLAFLLPPAFSVFLHSQGTMVGEGWTLATDLGWRSRLYALGSGFFKDRLEPNVSLIQDHGTLFVTRNRLLLQDLALRRAGRNSGAPAPGVSVALNNPPDTLITVDLSNANRELIPWVERFQAGARFLLFPSIAEVESLHAVVQWKEGSPMHGAMTILAKHTRATEQVRADVEYLMDLLDRVMSTGDVGMEKTVQATPGRIEAAVTLHHPERLARIPWGKR